MPYDLYRISDDSWSDVLSYLSLKDLCKFDGAFTNRSQRKWFLRRLRVGWFLQGRPQRQDAVFDLSTGHGPLRGSGAMEWVLKRGIHLASLILPRMIHINVSEFYKIYAALQGLLTKGLLNGLVDVDMGRSLCFFNLLEEILIKSHDTIRRLDVRTDKCDTNAA